MLSCGTHQYAAGGSASCRALCARTYATRAIANRCLRVRRHPAYPVCCRIRRLCICGSTIGIVQPSISPIRHVTYGTTYATRGIVPQTTSIHSQPAHSVCNNTHATTTHRPPRPGIMTSGNARMRQHTRDGNPPSSTPGHHDIRQDTHAATYTVCRFANSRVQASQRPASSVFRHMHHLNNRRRCVSQSSHDAG